MRASDAMIERPREREIDKDVLIKRRKTARMALFFSSVNIRIGCFITCTYSELKRAYAFEDIFDESD